MHGEAQVIAGEGKKAWGAKLTTAKLLTEERRVATTMKRKNQELQQSLTEANQTRAGSDTYND